MNVNEAWFGLRNGPYGYGGCLPVKQKKFADREVSRSMEKIMPGLNPDKEIVIISGSLLRDLLTTEEVGEILRHVGFTVGRAIVYPELDEVSEFSWDIFAALMEGGEIRFEGVKFSIDKLVTNPKGLAYPEYFIDGWIGKIPDAVKKSWRTSFRYKIENMETFASVQSRFAGVLENLPREKQIILVTHDGVLLGSVMEFTGKKRGLQPAGFVEFGFKENRVVVRRVFDSNGDITEVNSSIDIIKALKNKYKAT